MHIPALRAALLLIAAASVVGATRAEADVCPGGLMPISCHSISPNEDVAIGGGSYGIDGYPPIALFSGKLEKPATDVGEYASDPSLRMEVAGGVWGSDGNEPMAVGWVDYEYAPAEGLNYLWDPYADERYEFECVPPGSDDSEPLCHDDGSVVSKGVGFVQRRYRVTKVDSAQLPDDVTSAPILIDYSMAIVRSGERQGEMGTLPTVRGETSVGFGRMQNVGGGYLFKGSTARCWRNDGPTECSLEVADEGSSPAEPSGTIHRSVPIDGAAPLYLRVSAMVRKYDTPVTCEVREELDGDPCLVEPWSGSGHAAADPYVYVDPTWEYADAVKVEMAADESETTWVTPVRTPFDPETLTLGDPADEPDAGPSTGGQDAGAPGDDGGAPGTPGTPGDGDGDGDGDGGCGCQASPGSSPVATGALIAFAFLASTRRRRRAQR